MEIPGIIQNTLSRRVLSNYPEIKSQSYAQLVSGAAGQF
jgi:hypothetical protein